MALGQGDDEWPFFEEVFNVRDGPAQMFGGGIQVTFLNSSYDKKTTRIHRL